MGDLSEIILKEKISYQYFFWFTVICNFIVKVNQAHNCDENSKRAYEGSVLENTHHVISIVCKCSNCMKYIIKISIM
jgi:hypothetical protein